MEDISNFIWLGIAVLWILSRLVGRGVKKVADTQRKRPRQGASSTAGAETSVPRVDGRPLPSGRGGTGPPPIVPR